MSREKIVGTPQTRFEKIGSLYSKAEDTIQNFINRKLRNVRINRKQLIDRLEEMKGNFANERDAKAIDRQIDDFIDLLKTRYDDYIDVGRINDLKRSTYKNAYNKAGEKVLDDVEHAIGDILKNEVEAASGAISGVKINGMTLQEFNRYYGDIINARKFLKAAVGKAQAGFFTRLALISAFASAGSPGGIGGVFLGGAAAQATANKIATPIKSALSSALSSAGVVVPDATIDNAIRGLVSSILVGSRQGTNQE
jgi:hypothetical protein